MQRVILAKATTQINEALSPARDHVANIVLEPCSGKTTKTFAAIEPLRHSTPVAVIRFGSHHAVVGQLVRSRLLFQDCHSVGLVIAVDESFPTKTTYNGIPVATAAARVAFPTLNGTAVESYWVPTNQLALATLDEIAWLLQRK